MVVPRFLRFYSGYTLTSVLDEYAVRFFSLLNSMFRIQADEQLASIESIAVANNGNTEMIQSLQKKSQGLHGIIEEVRTVKKARNV